MATRKDDIGGLVAAATAKARPAGTRGAIPKPVQVWSGQAAAVVTDGSAVAKRLLAGEYADGKKLPKTIAVSHVAFGELWVTCELTVGPGKGSDADDAEKFLTKVAGGELDLGYEDVNPAISTHSTTILPVAE